MRVIVSRITKTSSVKRSSQPARTEYDEPIVRQRNRVGFNTGNATYQDCDGAASRRVATEAVSREVAMAAVHVEAGRAAARARVRVAAATATAVRLAAVRQGAGAGAGRGGCAASTGLAAAPLRS